MPFRSSLLRSGRASAAALLAVLALVPIAPGAGAWTVTKTTGAHGRWSFDGTAASPGAYCGVGTTGLYLYPNDSLKTWARNLTSGPDRWYVGLSVIDQKWKDGRWVGRGNGGSESKRATDTVPATFPRGWGEVPSPGKYRIKLKLIWYTSTWGVVAGTLTIRIGHHLYESETDQADSCPS